MAFRFTTGLCKHSLRTPLLFGGAVVGAGLCSAQSQILYRQPIRLDSSPAAVSAKDWSINQYQHDAQVPIVKKGRFNVRSVRQLSAGSIIGLAAGLVVSTFSKSLVLVIGLLIWGVQTAESYGLHIVPYQTIGKYVKGVNVRSAVQDNVAFKLSFGLMFALSAFAELPQ